MTNRKLIGFVHNSRVPETLEFVETLVEAHGLHEACWVSSAGDIQDMRRALGDTCLIVIAGGDGTILRAMRVIAPYEVPIVGINMGRVGFMSELRVDEAMQKLPMYLDGGLRVEERMMLQASVTAPGEDEPRLTLHALNDVVVGRGSVARLLDIETTIDGVPLTSYRADAVIVATATGSTGYALSAGGPILYPETRVILIQPVAAHTGLRTGLLLREESVIEMKASDGYGAFLSVDGFPDTSLDGEDRVTVQRSPYTARFLRARPPETFYEALTRRLGLEPPKVQGGVGG
ncbi:MAG: NAD(+)/NADH kinase [Chloroflexi bacterium]|nr:NAD(+)/NADH kinase [Chloroflexota bacterium]